MDRISDLPEAIILHILSFIPSTIDVVKTSVLAKRWSYLWTQIPNIHFDDSQVPFSDRVDAFVHSVNGVLRLYKARYEVPRIERICLSIHRASNAVIVDDWVHFAIQVNVKELSVQLNANMTDSEPLEMPSCGSVKVLRLHLGNRGLKLPTGAFISLETLSFSSVDFINGRILNRVLKQCPCLKSLSFHTCTGLRSIKVASPLLEDLDIRRCEGLCQLSVSAEKLLSLCVHDSFKYGSPSVKVFAPSLQSFNWLDYIVSEDAFDIGTFTSLKAARVSLVVNPDDTGLYLSSAGNFLKSLASAESLAVEIACFWGLSTNRQLLEELSTTPHNLKHMTLLVGFDDDVYQGISYLFKSCPKVETLEIKTIDENTHELLKRNFPYAPLFDGDEHPRYQSQQLAHLQEVSVCGFRGKDHEIEFVKFLLDNSVSLKRMTIRLSIKFYLDENGKADVTQRLLELKRVSPDAVVSVS